MRLLRPSRTLSACLLSAILAAGALAAPGLAQAGDAKCLWKAAKKADKENFFKAYPAKGPAAARMVMGSDPNAAEAIPHACKVAPANEPAAAHALLAYASSLASAIVLKAKFGVDPVVLRKTLMAIPPADRAHLAAIARNQVKGPAEMTFARGVMAATADKLKLTDPVAKQELTIYIASSVSVEADQPHF